MIHERKGLALGFEPRNDLFGVHAELYDFEGDSAADRFLLLGNVYDAHPALTEFFQQLVTADPLTQSFGKRRHRSYLHRVIRQQTSGWASRSQELFHSEA
jgi:hypothetical protein